MVDQGKRKKYHDKDKYYRLAKEQGLRSRAAFKLSQINRKFPCLEKSEVAVLDLCAAPGGWTQIAARTCPQSTQIIAVDILPIRSIRGHAHNVTTIVGDITTDKCKADIKRALGVERSGLVDTVLHDGAPNIGADYAKDAYEQNEIAVHALRCATQHLKPGGTFITKIYRSRDYASYHWVLQQLFDTVVAFKPKASRQASAEIFLVAQSYKAPAKLDARLLDPKHIFEHFEGQTTGGRMSSSGATANAIGNNAALSVFAKNYEKLVGKRHRGGYDMTHLDFSMRHVVSVLDFVHCQNLHQAIQILSNSTGMHFNASSTKTEDANDGGDDTADNSASVAAAAAADCHYLLHHPLTTPEIKEYVSDLQVLNKTDFKALITWRTKMQEALEVRHEQQQTEPKAETEIGDAGDDDKEKDDADADSDREEAEIQAEIEEMRQRRLREKKKIKKKERTAAGKRRRHAALGMDLNAIDITDHDQLFSLSSIGTRGDLLAASEVNLDQVTDEQIFGADPDNDDIVIEGTLAKGGKCDGDDDDDDEAKALLRQRERELDEAYDTYLQTTKNGLAKSGTKMQKRSKKSQRLKIVQEASEDQEMLLAAPSGIDHDTKAYVRMLQGGTNGADSDSDASSDKEADSSDDDVDDDGFNADPMTPEEHAAYARAKKSQADKGDVNPLIHKFDDPASAKTARWFSNPLFESIGKATESATTEQEQQQRQQSSSRKLKESSHNDDDDDDDDDDINSDGSDSDDSEEEKSKPASRSKKEKPPVKDKNKRIDAEDVLAMMPKTDKEKRHEKRLKQMERDERKKTRRAKGNEDPAFQLAPGDTDKDNESDDPGDEKLKSMSEPKRRQVLEAREQIKAGLGKAYGDTAMAGAETGFEVVAIDEDDHDQILPIKDTRKYDSDHEEYDSDDYAETLALGTMILRRSKEKALVDASYNRYAWNDPPDLPEWFVDDEKKHHRPQLPVPPALLAKIKEKMMAQATKPIAKVAEARARKSKRARAKLAAAKKQAEAVANSSEMSEAMKLKAVSKALRGHDAKKPSKTYVVAKKGRGMTGGGKGVKVVDKRLKSDKRGQERTERKRKKGKQGGMVGSKRRRHHK